jgi:uncharacterized membrane protein
MSSMTAEMDKPAAGRGMALALFASIAVNLVLIGATGGFLLRHGGDVWGGPTVPLVPNLLTYTGTLPEERRRELWTQTEDARRTMQPLRRDLRAAREETLKVLTAPVFDKQAYAQSQTRLMATDRKAREAIYNLYGEIAAHLTPEERAGFVPWREKHRPRRNLLDDPQK